MSFERYVGDLFGQHKYKNLLHGQPLSYATSRPYCEPSISKKQNNNFVLIAIPQSPKINPLGAYIVFMLWVAAFLREELL